jgi:hypothetical protein
MIDKEGEACNCGHEHDEATGNCSCGCDCDACSDDSMGSESTITMTDTETGEEYTFSLADDFVFEDEHYCVLVTVDEDEDPEMIITKVVKLEDGSEGLMSLDDSEYDRVYAEYERICEEDTDEDEAGDEEE